MLARELVAVLAAEGFELAANDGPRPTLTSPVALVATFCGTVGVAMFGRSDDTRHPSPVVGALFGLL